MQNLDLEHFLARLKSIVSLAQRFGVKTGLKVSFIELEKIRRDLHIENREKEAGELQRVIEFLRNEESLSDELFRKRVEKISQLSEEVPVGMLLTFRYPGGDLTGELKGYLADRALIEVRTQFRDKKIYEVYPFDIKL